MRQREAGDVAEAVVGGLDRDMAVAVGQRDEIALGIDHDLLHLARALFEQAAQQVRLAAARIALDEQAGSEQFLKVDRDRLADGATPMSTRTVIRLLWRAGALAKLALRPPRE